jgi:hypothetical protein
MFAFKLFCCESCGALVYVGVDSYNREVVMPHCRPDQTVQCIGTGKLMSLWDAVILQDPCDCRPIALTQRDVPEKAPY